jgi:hypothetical protein
MLSRRKFIQGVGLAGAAVSLGKFRRARAAGEFKAKHVVVVGIGGGLRMQESLGMAEGATMPNLFGSTPIVSGFGSGGASRLAPEYVASMPEIVTPPPLATPLYTQGALVTNLRYAEGAPGHLQGQACLISGAYNNIENRADAHAPSPTLFEIHRRQTNAPATDAWYVSQVGGFYRALQASDNPGFGPDLGGAFLSPPNVMTPLVPILVSGRRELQYGRPLPVVRNDDAERAATFRLRGVLDDHYPQYPAGGDARTTPSENQAIEGHVAGYYADASYQAYYPDSLGIGVRQNGQTSSTADAITVYHAEQILARFQPSVLFITLLDIDQCHMDFNGYLQGQMIADACVRHLWEMIQATDGLRDQTALLVLPEHGRHLFHNGQNPDSLGRSGIDHGQGDDGDRNVWLLALGPDFQPGVVAPTGIVQDQRTSGRWETIDMTMTAATLLGHGDVMRTALERGDFRPGMPIADILK